MAGQYEQVVGINGGLFGVLSEEIVGMADNVLVQRRAGCHQHHQRRTAASACPACLLPGTRHTARVAAHDTHVERTDVNTEFEGIRTDYGEHFAIAQPLLNFTAFRGQIAPAITAHLAGITALFPHRFPEIGGDDLHAQATPCEHNGLDVAEQQRRRQMPYPFHAGRPNAQFAVDHRGIVEQKMFFAGRRTVVVHQFNWHLHQFFRQLPGIRNGSAATDELRGGAVERADAFQTSDHIGKVAAEYTAILVNFVYDHITQIFKKPNPDGVMGQNTRMEHVRICHHNMTGIAHRFACRGRRIAIESVRTDFHVKGFNGLG